jgi:peptidylprolyl isomerase
MPQAKKGDFVHVHYTGRLNDKSVFDTSDGRDPLTFQLGKGQVVPGFDRAISGMEVGEKKTVNIPSAEAYGPRVDQLVFTAPRENLPPGLTMDGNHPLAGKDLTFDIQLVKID